MTILRSNNNPIISPISVTASESNMEVIGVFNAGVARYNDEIVLLLRVAERPINHDTEVMLVPVYDPASKQIRIETILKHPDHDMSDVRVIKTPKRNYLTSMSHLRVARSKDGINFTIDAEPTIMPDTIYESYGIEDPRITQIGDTYYITYSAISEYGICTGLITTTDFLDFERKGNVFHPDNKDVVIFPRKIGDKYYALHRPSCSHYGNPEMWIAESSDLLQWGNHQHLIGVREGSWDGGRIGASAIPFEIEEGWLEIYHGADSNNRYCLGALLLDKNEPWKVLARSEIPFMEPERDYEVEGFFGNVIFPCGVLYEDGLIKIYYGAGDTCVGYAETTLEFIKENLSQGSLTR
ncbi:glycosidase [Paenibacillus psychroresistens]|uniref:Glycosidase n=1 Tax=Paenibacillus psychroresistens TaxID=1778678 RepID=A0A6B8RPA4_9BACL|nr:glycoside hydrolase family 130 protein [Paenibacillus psychroresistens]QGQ98191.1 glycosidase [Paenibacillus psychroresistens]